MARFDLENFRDYFLGLFQTNLSAKVTAINAEKADSITLSSFVADQYTSDMNEKVLNYEEFIYYGFPEILTNANAGMGFSQEITMSFEVVIADPNGGTLAETKLMRYTRALFEIIEENMQANPQIGDIEIEVFSPVTLTDNQGSPLSKVGGISIKGTLA